MAGHCIRPADAALSGQLPMPAPLIPDAGWQQAWQQCQVLRWRLPVWLSGDQAFLQAQWAQISAHATAQTEIGWLGALWPEQAVTLPSLRPVSGQARQQVLGQQYDWLVVNACAGVDWDLVAASIGCVKAGGLWLLLSPEPAQFAGQPNPLATKVLSYPTDARRHVGQFQRYLSDCLQQLPVWQISAAGSGWCQPPDWPAPQAGVAAQGVAPYASADQQQAVSAIHRVANGHRHRPLVLTAHRGRGKSAALGIAALELAAAGKSRLIITAPQPAAAAVALMHATAASGSALEFWPLDRLLREQPPADLLMVDEAAAIPTPQLQQLTTLYSRMVFASTAHGYEGSGRGFQLRFFHYLRQQRPQWRHLQLNTPVRYGAQDILEQLSFRLFLLDTEPAAERPHISTADASYQWLPAQALATRPDLLAQVMTLAALAHYQTSVRDLWALLDDPGLTLLLVCQQQQLLGMAVLSLEGQLATALSHDILQGTRRVQGHLGAQSLAYALASPQLAEVCSWRIQRLMVQPSCQHQGLGRQMLQQILAEALQRQIPLLTTSFGATPSLVSFWQHAGFSAVRLSDKPDQRSNECSVLMLSSATPALQVTVQKLHQAFRRQLWHSLSQQHQQLAPALALAWAEPPQDPPDDHLLLQVQLFAGGQRPLSDSWYALQLFFSHYRACFPLEQQQLWASWCWQRQPIRLPDASPQQSLQWCRQSVGEALQQLHNAPADNNI